ncbi:MAG: PQQ-dependent sugar dehydrogenase [Planctomycetes bacterium]|nr:PQQ-dependent sugar dehydrogenase [Planctomycetota bacterium]
MLRSLLVPLAVAAVALAPRAQTVPSGFVIDTLVNTGLLAPNDFCFLPDGRALLANRGGEVMVFAEGVGIATIGTVPSVETGSERGLLSIEADPDFDTNGYFYVWYSSGSDSFLKLDRYQCTGQLSNPNSTAITFSSATRRVILASVPDSAFNHNGGSARFGPDGMLYLTIGDDAVSCNAQSTTSSVGCLLRMNVSTAVLGTGASTVAPTFTALDPGTNPLSANADISQLVIAHGLRNPFRMEIDQLTGNVYIGDVGLSTREEYTEYVYPSSGPLPLRNFGWPWREGLTAGGGCSGSQPPGLVDPLADAVSPWDSIMGGPRYRNQGGPNDFGASFEGDAFFLDYFAGELRRLDWTGTAWPATASSWGSGFTAVTALRQAPDGSMWVVQQPSTYATTGGSLKRVRPLGPTNSVVAISGNNQLGAAGEVFGQPVVARVLDTNGNPLPFGTVNFAVTGPAILTTANPVIADASGFVQTSVIATTSAGGAITVTGSTPGSATNGVFSLFSRRLTVTPAGSLLVVSVLNKTDAVPAQVPLIVMMSFPQTPMLPTFFGPVFTNPYVSSTLVLDDGFGHFPTVAWGGTGGTGTPSLTKVYTVPAGLLTGQRMTLQVVGWDPLTGWFRTNTEVRQF